MLDERTDFENCSVSNHSSNFNFFLCSAEQLKEQYIEADLLHSALQFRHGEWFFLLLGEILLLVTAEQDLEQNLGFCVDLPQVKQNFSSVIN